MYTLFYAEDDQDDVFLFKTVLKEINEKHNVVIARNGQELLDMLHNPPPSPHLVFLDLNMPVRNGIDSLREIRENKSFGQVPVIVLSTSSDENSIEKVKNLGADLYMVKPDNYAKLRKSMTACFDIDWFNFRKNAMDFSLIK